MKPGSAAASPATLLALLCALVLAWSGLLVLALWSDLAAPERLAAAELLRPRGGLVFLFVLSLPLLLAGLVWPWVRAWSGAAHRLLDEIAIVTGANPRHPVSVTGAAPMRALAQAVQRLADRHASERDEVQARIAQASARLTEESRRLGALMSELPQAVLVSNEEGRILLYNARAAQLFAQADGHGSPIGLDRPLTALLDGAAVAHAMDQIQRRVALGQSSVTAQLVTRRGPALLRVQVVPIAGLPTGPAGHVLIVEDATRSMAELGRRDLALQRLTQGTRSALANLRAAAQALQQYPAMDAQRRARFTAVVDEESGHLASQLEQALHEQDTGSSAAWPRDEMQLADLVFALQGQLAGLLPEPLECRFDAGIGARWVEVDSHAIVLLLAHLLGRIAGQGSLAGAAVELVEQGRLLRLELVWCGPAPDPRDLQAWEAEPLQTAAGAVTVREVLDRHGAELWGLAEPSGSAARLCLQLVAASPSGSARSSGHPAAPVGRPISYDFDLFHQRGQTREIDDVPLAASSFTVFDTETTGLRPGEGDEIIAIGAVRIVNARLLEHESFDRLTRPRRPVRASAEAVHGISTARLQGEPPLERVLPEFARFAEGTVLVAHNAAFDMRFLELARERTGVRFDQPVLDTLLLASVVMPGHGAGEYHLEQLAERLGLPPQARHQALADALTTAQVFLRLLPLLAERDIHTLGQAREACKASPLARERF